MRVSPFQLALAATGSSQVELERRWDMAHGRLSAIKKGYAIPRDDERARIFDGLAELGLIIKQADRAGFFATDSSVAKSTAPPITAATYPFVCQTLLALASDTDTTDAERVELAGLLIRIGKAIGTTAFDPLHPDADTQKTFQKAMVLGNVRKG